MPDFETALKSFVVGCQAISDKGGNKATLSIDPKGVKFVRIVRESYGQNSVHCFVDKTNGDVLKAAGWKAPAKHARGNIYDESNGLSKMDQYGPKYLR